MVHIKKLELRGFKSFGNRLVVVHFDKGLIGITGPNGSGKSNIIDAVLFSLGQNSPRTLRVNKLGALVFDGAGGNKPEQAKSTLTLDNSDRLIHIDSDNVTITREIKSTGDSGYLLNGKRIQRGNLMQILSLAMIDPDGLNFVPQGMVTRLAELNSEEKRMIIEEIVGVAQFDEKKERAIKQLDDADRKLEVALARIGEIRSRIDSLEGDRNDELRLKFLERDIKWLKAIMASKKLSNVRIEMKECDDLITSFNEEKKIHDGTIIDLSNQIESAEMERGEFFNSVFEGRSGELVGLQVKVSQKSAELDQNKTKFGESENTLQKISDALPHLSQMRDDGIKEIAGAKSEIESLEERLGNYEKDKKEMDEKMQEVDSKKVKLDRELSRENEKALRHTEKIERYSESLNEVAETISETSSKIGILDERLAAQKSRVSSTEEMLTNMGPQIREIESIQTSYNESVAQIESSNSKVSTRKESLEKEVEKALDTLQKANEAVVRHESQITAAKGLASRESAFAKLKEASGDNILNGISGRLEDILKMNGKYSVPLMAAGTRWKDAIVVMDMGSLIKVVELIKRLKLERVALIPISEVSDAKKVTPPEDSEVLGCLADYLRVEKDLQGLVNFVFGDTLLVKSTKSAYLLSQRGFRTVTRSGDLFEAGGLVLETGNILPVADLIFDASSYSAIKEGIDSLRSSISKRKEEINTLSSTAKQFESDKNSKSIDIAKLDSDLSNMKSLYSTYEKAKRLLEGKAIKRTEKTRKRLVVSLERHEKLSNGLKSRIEERKGRREATSVRLIQEKINDLNKERDGALTILDKVSMNMRDLVTELTRKRADLEHNLESSLGNLEEEIKRVNQENNEKTEQMNKAKDVIPRLEDELTELRIEEGKAEEESKRSKPILEGHDKKIKLLNKERDVINRTISGIENKYISASKSLESLTGSEQDLVNELSIYGYSTTIESFNGAERIREELEVEYENLRDDVNLRADKDYREIYVGYKSISERKNQLESERNAIVGFIDSIDSEKRKAFLEAFEKIDRELRMIFSKITNGSAWLELENPDDIFSSGVLLMAQFPNKIARESGMISGGEKTVSALSLILAIQAVNPAPFYIFDEIDAHLDAVNSDRLAELLKERAGRSQIVIVSLKDVILSRASAMYGVYMENSLSKVLKYQPKIEVKKRSG